MEPKLNWGWGGGSYEIGLESSLDYGIAGFENHNRIKIFFKKI